MRIINCIKQYNNVNNINRIYNVSIHLIPIYNTALLILDFTKLYLIKMSYYVI